MGYRWRDHVGEVELAIEAASEGDVFVEATRAFAELLEGEGPAEGDAPHARREVRAQGPDRAARLAGWLDELVFLAETDGFVPEAVEAIELGAGEARGRLRGRLGAPAHLVKAVTHHRLAFEPAGAGWTATVVLDV